MEKKICIVGAGGFGRETLTCLIDSNTLNKNIEDSTVFMVDDEFYDSKEIMGVPVLKTSDFDYHKYKVVIAIADPILRKDMAYKLPNNTEYTSIIHPSAIISKWVKIGNGSIISAGSILTCNIEIGNHAHINLHTTVGHDCTIGSFFTTAPAVNISGNCTIGDCVYIGTNASIREKITICDNVTIGMGSVVVKNIKEKGIYIGNPSKMTQKCSLHNT